MKHCYYFLLILFFSPILNKAYSQNIYSDLMQNISTDSMMNTIKELSGYVPVTVDGEQYTITSRLYYLPGKELARRYLQQRLDILGLPYTIQQFDADTGKSIIVTIPGTLYPEKEYIICAHYDDMSNDVNIAPGADDNASGVAVVLEAARLLKNYSSPYTVMFILWDEEEKGRVGSMYYAAHAKAVGELLLGVINLDMVSYDGNNDSKAQVRTIDTASSVLLANKAVEFNSTYNIGLDLVYLNPGYRRSDHASFWDKGFGAICLIEETDFNRNPHYHKLSDSVVYINPSYLTKLAQTAILTFAYFTGMTSTPVELESFTATYNGVVNLTWTTASETNNKGFFLQRQNKSSDGWKNLIFIQGKGTSVSRNVYSYKDDVKEKGEYYYRLKQVDYDGSEKIYNVISINISKDLSFTLQNYPNPFNPVTQIRYSLPLKSKVELKVYNILSEQISELVHQEQSAGEYTIDFNGSNLPSGMYIYQLKTEHGVLSKSMLLLK